MVAPPLYGSPRRAVFPLHTCARPLARSLATTMRHRAAVTTPASAGLGFDPHARAPDVPAVRHLGADVAAYVAGSHQPATLRLAGKDPVR